MSRGYGIYQRAILATLIAPWNQQQEKCHCVRCVERLALRRIMNSNAWWRLRYSTNPDNIRRSYRRAFDSLIKKDVIGICEHCGTVQLWDDLRDH